MTAETAPAQPMLVVEDDAGSRESLARLLESEGYRVATAANGEEALRYLHACPPPCLILLDMKMPVMDGREFLRRQQAEEQLASIPVLLISGRADREPLLAHGAVGAFTKPLRIEALLAEIAQWCPSPRTAAEDAVVSSAERGPADRGAAPAGPGTPPV